MDEKEKADQYLLDECKTIAENCLYTAQTHYEMANKKIFRTRLLLLIIPSCVAAIAGILTAVGFPGWLGAISAVAGFITAIASYLGIDQQAMAHKQAANLLTALRHEARALSETYWRELPHGQLVAEVRRLGDRYNSLIQALETTDTTAFELARKRIQSGIFEMDFRQQSQRKSSGGDSV